MSRGELNNQPRDKTIKIYPLPAIRMTKSGKGLGAVRIYFLAKHFNSWGSQRVIEKDFRDWIIGLGINKRRYYRWLKDALDLGLINREGGHLVLISYTAMAINSGSESIGAAYMLTMKQFLQRDLLSHLWKCYMVGFNGKITSRAKLEKRTGIKPKTQYRYEKKRGIKRTCQYASDPAYKADDIEAFREFKNPTAFVHLEKIYWCIGSIVEVSGVQTVASQRQRKIQRDLDNLETKVLRDYSFFFRSFNRSDKQLKQTFRNLRKRSIADKRIPEYVYLLDKANLWQAVRV